MSRTYRENYPTGRKFCSRCGRWRHVIDFPVRKWVDWQQSVPQTLSALCRPCNAECRRIKTGGKPRVLLPKLSPEAEHERRRSQNRASAARRRQSPEYRERQNEYWRIWHQARSGAVARLTIAKSLERVDAAPFLDWHDDRPDAQMSLADEDRIREARIRARKGPTTVLFSLVDNVMTQNGSGYLVGMLYPTL